MSAIQMTPEAVAAVNALCEPGNLNGNIDNLEWVEDELQKVAEENGQDHLFRYAYHVKRIRLQFENLLKTLGYERELSE